MISTRILTGAELDARIDDIAALRIEVFRDFPYLYDGSLDYERSYLSVYQTHASAIVVGAFDGDTLVGASTGTAMSDHSDDFGSAFTNAGLRMDDMFYCAESVLLSAYRGHGLGHKFFDAREEFARKLGFQNICFCAVQRPANHPLRPAQYRPLDRFWLRRGYEKLPGVVASFSWTDVGLQHETQKKLNFWSKSLKS